MRARVRVKVRARANPNPNPNPNPNQAAFALRELQRSGCAASGAAEGSAGCAVLRDARLARLAAASTLVRPDPHPNP